MTMVAGIDIAGVADAPRWAVRTTRRYCLIDLLTGEDYEVGSGDLARIVGVEVGYIDWVIAEDGVFENGRWRVR